MIAVTRLDILPASIIWHSDWCFMLLDREDDCSGGPLKNVCSYAKNLQDQWKLTAPVTIVLFAVPLATKKADRPASRPGSVASSHNGDKLPSRPASVAGSHSGSDNNV